MKKLTTVLLVAFLLLNTMVSFASDVDMRLYIKKDTAPDDEQAYHGAKYEPKVGTYLGMFAEGDPAVHDPWTGDPFYFDGVPDLTGKKHAMYMIYIHYGDMEFNHYMSHYIRAKENDCGMQVALEPNNGLSEVQDDAYLHEFAKQAKESGIPIFLRFANEMNDPGSTWGNDPALYIEKFQLVANVMHKEAPNVAMCWAPNDWGHNGFGDAHEWYPGDDYVDWVGISSYPPYLADGESKHKTKFTDRLATIYDAYADRKPIYLSEGAPIQNVEFEATDVSDVAAKDLKEFYDEVARRFPAIKAVFYWDNEETWGAARKCKISDNPKVLEAYKQAIADPYFLSEMNAQSSVIYVDLAHPALPPIDNKIQEISAYVGNHSLKTAYVKYYLNDSLIGTAFGSPYPYNIDFTNYSGETVTIKAESYDLDQNLIHTINQSVKVGGTPKPTTLDNALLKFGNMAETHWDIGFFKESITIKLGDQDITDNFTDGIKVIENRAAVGLRDLTNVLGDVTIEWNADYRTVIIKTPDKTLAYPINRNVMYDGEKIITIDTQATIDPAINKTYLPIRSIAESLGYDVIWDGETSTITLTR